MSSFVVDDETINMVVSYLYAKGNGPDSWRAVKLAKMGYDLTNPEHCEKLANLMFELNVAAVNARYGEGEAEKFRPLNFKYLLAFTGSQMQAIKALETWLYQCLEKDVHLHRLYGAMEQIRDMLCIDYVHSSEEYEAVRWGMTPSEKVVLEMLKEAGGATKIAAEKLEKELEEEEQKHGGE